MKYHTRKEKLLVPETSRPLYFSVTTVLSMIEKIIGEKLNISLEKEQDLLTFLRRPEDFTSNVIIQGKIKDLNTLLVILEEENKDAFE